MTHRPRLEITIDELVVGGLAPAEARVAASSFEARLAVLAERGGEVLTSRAEAVRRLSPVEAPAGSPSAVGAAAAAAVWGEIAGGRR